MRKNNLLADDLQQLRRHQSLAAQLGTVGFDG
jgi:hypothetical protein